jgi:hypothetical protein
MESKMFYVIPKGENNTLSAAYRTHDFDEAKEKCDALKTETGTDHYVIDVKMVWTTETLEQLLADNI